MSKRQITIKPSCARDLAAFPAAQSGQLWDKINLLVGDPLADGSVKKKLRASNDIYRLRVGDYRVFYQFGDEWISLLGIRRRNEATYEALPEGSGSGPLPPESDDDLDAVLAPEPEKVFTFRPHESGRKLPFEISIGWLNSLGIPASARAALIRCKTEEHLLGLALPDEVMARVVDAMFPPSIERVAQQPDLVVASTDDLVRFKEGDLLGFLLRLDDEQLALTNWALNGPTMIKGGAGTGKSTVAIYRVKAVLERPGGTGLEKLLFTTYTRALVAASQQLLGQLLTSTQMKRVTVSSCDQVACDIVAAKRRLRRFEVDVEARKRLGELRGHFRPPAESAFESKLRARALGRLTDQYLLEEFDWIIAGRDLDSVGDYVAAPRPGRGIAFSERLRRAVWDLYQAFRTSTANERFPEVRREALRATRHPGWRGHWDYVFVDEAQDLSPTALALMAEVCRRPEGLFFAADSKQSLYSRNYTWTSAHPRLQFRGRSATLKRNYRSTREIDLAAFGVLRPEEDEVLEPSSSLHEGPIPVLLRGVSSTDEAKWIARFVQQMSRYLRLGQGAAAVLVPRAEVGEALAAGLHEAGVPATFFAGRDLDLGATGVKVLTMHSAKGLEFPIVVVAGLHEGTYSVPEDFEEPGLYAERMRHERRLLYVALTRAMRGLMLVAPKGCRHEAVEGLDSSQWSVEDV